MQFLTRNQLAERWQVSEMTLKRYEQKGIIKPCKIAERVVRYRLSDIETHEEQSTLDRSEVPA